MGLFGDIAGLVGGLTGAFGSKVQVPQIKGINADTVQQQTAQGNLNVLPQAQQLAGQINAFNAQQMQGLIDQLLPGFKSNLATAQASAGDLMAGKLPGDVVRSVTDLANARAVGGGYGGSGLQHNLTLRDLGLTSLQAQQMGLNQFGSILGMAQGITPNLYNFSTAFMTPGQRLQFEQQQQSLMYGRDLVAAQAAAAPDPSMVATIKYAGSLGDDVSSFGAGMLGGLMGGGGAKGGSGGGGYNNALPFYGDTSGFSGFNANMIG